MRFIGATPIVNGAVDADPITTPTSVATDKIVNIGNRVDGSDKPPTTMRLSFPGTAGETVTLSIYAIDADTLYNAEGRMTPATANYYLVSAGVVVTANIVQTVNIPAGGPFYMRVTAETVGADRALKVASWVS